MQEDQKEKLARMVREHYANVALGGASCCAAGESCACGPAGGPAQPFGHQGHVYSSEQRQSAPPGADLGLGCGNPLSLAGLRSGEVVVDLGSGPGLDCFLAAQAVGRAGRVIGVDMTDEMLAKARANQAAGGFANVEFRQGRLERLPLDDQTADVVISNCVINLTSDKALVLAEAFRVLKPGGRLAVMDMVATRALPEEIGRDALLHASCLAGAMPLDELRTMLEAAGFVEIRIDVANAGQAPPEGPITRDNIFQHVRSAAVTARRPF